MKILKYILLGILLLGCAAAPLYTLSPGAEKEFVVADSLRPNNGIKIDCDKDGLLSVQWVKPEQTLYTLIFYEWGVKINDKVYLGTAGPSITSLKHFQKISNNDIALFGIRAVYSYKGKTLRSIWAYSSKIKVCGI